MKTTNTEIVNKADLRPTEPISTQPPVPCTPTEIAFANLIADLQREVAGLTKHRDILIEENQRLTKEVKDWMGDRVELLRRINTLM